MQDNHSDLLDRLNHPEGEKKPQKIPTQLFIRNILNTLFIIMAIATMTGIGLSWGEGETPMWCYLLGIAAVIIKMCESLLRMPALNKSNGIRRHRRSGR